MQDKKVVKKPAPTTVYLPRKQFINFAEFSILNAEELVKFLQGPSYLRTSQQAFSIQAGQQILLARNVIVHIHMEYENYNTPSQQLQTPSLRKEIYTCSMLKTGDRTFHSFWELLFTCLHFSTLQRRLKRHLRNNQLASVTPPVTAASRELLHQVDPWNKMFQKERGAIHTFKYSFGSYKYINSL